MDSSDYYTKLERYIDEYNRHVASKKDIRNNALHNKWSFSSSPAISPLATSPATGLSASRIFGVKYFKPNNGLQNLQTSDNVSIGDNVSIRDHPSQEIFLVIPSFFNSSSILHFNEENSFINILQNHGEVFLLHWLESGKTYNIDDVIDEITFYIKDKFSGCRVNIVGHCIGGVIAAAVVDKFNSEISSSKCSTSLNYSTSLDGSASLDSCTSSNGSNCIIASLSLLTCSWRFDHFINYLELMQALELDKELKRQKFIPKTFIQIMFFMLNPKQFDYKLEKYFSSCLESQKRILEVEYWLQSGINLPTSLYIDLLENIIKKNIGSYSNENPGVLQLGKSLIDPSKFDMPIFIAYCQNDNIVPKASVKPLIEAVSDPSIIELSPSIIELPGGHINYLVNNIHSISEPYNKWLSQNSYATKFTYKF